MMVALITGASRGIGRATAKKFAECGFAVAINYQKEHEAAADVCNEIKKNGGIAISYCANISKMEEVEKMVLDIKNEFGGIDVLVNNAGIAPRQALFTDVSDEDARKVFDTNVFGMMNCCRCVAPDFVKKHSGKIINVSSVWGVCGASCETIYSASKAAVIGFTKALARELAPSGINVNCVAPGMIKTDMNAHLSEAEIDAFRQEIPSMRIGDASEVADVIYFLASDNSRYINGQTISVDGGII